MKKIFLIIISIFLISGCTNSKTSKHEEYIKIINKYPHKTDSFTQGLFFDSNELYETTGLTGHSMLYKNIDLKTGSTDVSYKFDDNIFAEGSVIFKDKIYVLTYQNNKVFVFNKDLELLKEYNYEKEGWGLTTDGKYLIASDGTQNIYFLDENINLKKKIEVKFNGKEVYDINELEYINGYIWANLWHTTNIIIIDPNSGQVLKTLDFKGIYDITHPEEVLNGIAWNGKNLYITGKHWDTLFECKIKERLFKELNR